LKGSEVSLLAQIIGVVDAFDAMTTDRPYRRSLGIDRAFDELRGDVTKGAMDAMLVERFIDLAPAIHAVAPMSSGWDDARAARTAETSPSAEPPRPVTHLRAVAGR
jgi:response regulator RpfG family c-di-GMP phosphodiesterase